jgi:hypothetical protein
MKILCGVVLTLCVCSPLSAQVLGFGYEISRANQLDMREAGGVGLRVRFRGPIDLRYDYLITNGQRFDTPCGGFIFGPECAQQTIDYFSRLHNIFIAVRARLLSRGAFDLIALPEVGFVTGTISKRSAATGQEGARASGGGLGAGAGLELSATRVGGGQIGGWIAARYRRFVHPGTYAADSYDPHRGLEWIRSVEVGVTFALQPR